jgi:hypothetical protein
VTNYGSSVLNSIQLNFLGNIVNWSGSLSTLQQSDSIYLGDYTIPNTPIIPISIWSQNPNGTPDILNENDTLHAILNPGLIGSYSVGGIGSDFETLTQVAQILNNGFICGPVVFNIQPGTYIERVLFTPVSGASPINTITFQSANLDSSSVIWQYTAGGSNNNSTIQLNYAKYFIFKHLTIKALGTTYNTAVFLANAGNNTFMNNEIHGNTSSSGSGKKLFELYASVNTPADSTIILNNRFYKGGTQLVLGISKNNIVQGNLFEGPAGYSITAEKQEILKILGNKFTGSRTGSCIEINQVSKDILIERNDINITGSTPLMFTYANATPLNPIIVINNFISSNGSNLSIVSSANLKFYNNSFSSLSTSRSVSITNTYTNYDFKNNIFKNAGGKFYYFQSSSGNIVNTAQFFSNNNCFYNATSTQFNINSTVYNLSSWQSNFSLDVSSIVGDPQFNSSNDLHINNATILNGAGIPIPEVTLDFDQQLRDLNTPDIGADEFEINASTYENIAFLGVISPDSSSCVLNNQIEVSVVNHSTFPITSFLIKYWLFDKMMDSVWINTTMNPNDTLNVLLGLYDFNQNTAYDLRFEISKPNNQEDHEPFDNSYAFRYYFLENVKIFNKPVTDCSTDVELNIKSFPTQSIIWSTGETSRLIIVSNPGIYSVTVHTNGGCVLTDSITIN